MKDLADAAHVSRETIYKYEHGMVRAYPETAMLLESILNMKITLSLDLFQALTSESDKLNPDRTKETEEHTTRNIFREPKELIELGFGVLPTHKTPFDAISQTKSRKKESILLTNLEKNRNIQILKKMALEIKDLSDVTQKDAVFIMESERIAERIEGIPAVNTNEIEEMESCREFMRLLKERKN